MSAIRISASIGVRQPSRRVAIGETTIRQRANSTYEGARAALIRTTRSNRSPAVSCSNQCQMVTTGAADTAQTVA